RTALFRFRHADGSWRTMEGIGKLFLGGGSTQFVVNSRDVTESRSVEEQLRQAQKMEAVGRLAGGVAHDFNNLLTVIGGYGDLLAVSLADDPERRESVDEIVKAAARAAALTRQLLAFSRKQVLEMRVLDLRSIVDEAEKMLRRLIGEDIELVMARPETSAMVKADPGQIEQVLMNLAVNARDAMPKGGRLSIAIAREEIGAPLAFGFEAAPPGRYVALSVTDTGEGMDEKTRAHIFEPFFTTKDKGKGTGLGLSTVFGIVKQSGGFIDVTSGPGRGTTFKIVLPEAEGVPQGKRDSGVHRRHGTETILLVEDDAGVRELTRTLLERNGYRVVAADSLDDALAKADAFDGPIHLVLTDVVMPRGTGPDLVKALEPRRPEARILFMSGYTNELLAVQGLADRASGLLQKPFKEGDLLSRVREVLDAPASPSPVVA
ncbi:MAG: ATP-binding protein, partial [Acidobacteriota bacterium]